MLDLIQLAEVFGFVEVFSSRGGPPISSCGAPRRQHNGQALVCSLMSALAKKLKIGRWLFIGLICLGVVLQMLGAPISFWDLNGSEDDFISALLMGVAVLSGEPHYSPLHSSLLIRLISAPRYSFLYEHVLFHPPLYAH